MKPVLKKIYSEAGLLPHEMLAMHAYLTGHENLYDPLAFEKLFEYFAFDLCEMPYGTAKAKTGDPEHWIIERLQEVSNDEVS